jgi:hypothetical protein
VAPAARLCQLVKGGPPEQGCVRRHRDHAEPGLGAPSGPLPRGGLYAGDYALCGAGVLRALWLRVLVLEHLEGWREPEMERQVRWSDVDAVAFPRFADASRMIRTLPAKTPRRTPRTRSPTIINLFSCDLVARGIAFTRAQKAAIEEQPQTRLPYQVDRLSASSGVETPRREYSDAMVLRVARTG